MLPVAVSRTDIAVIMAIALPYILLWHGDKPGAYLAAVRPVKDHTASRRRLNAHLCLPVSVQIIAYKLGVVGSGPDVAAQI